MDSAGIMSVIDNKAVLSVLKETFLIHYLCEVLSNCYTC